jgi:hypothetical protein
LNFWNISYAQPMFLPLSIEDAAAFSLLVYHDKDNEPEIPDGYQLLCKCPPELQSKNYYGEAYYRLIYHTYPDGTKSTTPTSIYIVISHRGTVLNYDNIEDDLRVSLHEAPASFFSSSLKFTNYVHNLVKMRFSENKNSAVVTYIHVGHSLGAIHAELNYAYQYSMSETDGSYHQTYEISFESPGSKPIMEPLIDRGDISTTFRYYSPGSVAIDGDINLINTANDQITPPEYIYDYSFFDSTPIIKSQMNPIDFKYFSTYYTKYQHSMINIYNYIKKHGSNPSENLPDTTGALSAYEYYKNYYYGPTYHERTIYWDHVFSTYWNFHDEIHSGYGNDFYAYKKHMIENYLNVIQ